MPRISVDIDDHVLLDLQQQAAVIHNAPLAIVQARGQLLIGPDGRVRWEVDDDDLPLPLPPRRRRSIGGAGPAVGNANAGPAIVFCPYKKPCVALLGSESNPITLDDDEEEDIFVHAPTTYQSLPDDIIQHVFRFLPPKSRNALGCIDRRHRNIGARSQGPFLKIKVRNDVGDVDMEHAEETIEQTLASLELWLQHLSEPKPSAVMIGEQFHYFTNASGNPQIYLFTDRVISLVDKYLPNIRNLKISLNESSSPNLLEQSTDKDREESIMDGFKNVRELKVSGIKYISFEDRPWPTLEKLHVSFYETEDMEYMVSQREEWYENVVTYPRLKTVVLQQIWFESDEDMTGIVNLFVRNPAMEHLLMNFGNSTKLTQEHIEAMSNQAKPGVVVQLGNVELEQDVYLPPTWSVSDYTIE